MTIVLLNSLKYLFLKNYYYCVGVYVAGSSVEVRGQFCRIGSFISPLHGFLKSKSGGQACSPSAFTYQAKALVFSISLVWDMN